MQLLSSWGGLGLQARLPSWGDQAMLMAGQDPPPGWELQSLLLVGPPGSPDRRPSWDMLPALEDLGPPQQPPVSGEGHSHSSSSTSNQVCLVDRRLTELTCIIIHPSPAGSANTKQIHTLQVFGKRADLHAGGYDAQYQPISTISKAWLTHLSALWCRCRWRARRCAQHLQSALGAAREPQCPCPPAARCDVLLQPAYAA